MAVTKIKVRGYHLDLYGHVNNARYLEFLEEARWALIEEKIDLGDWQKMGRSFVVVNINISYKRPALLGDMLRIESGLSNVAEKNAVIHQNIFSDSTGKILTEADVTFVIIDIKTSKVVEIDDGLRALFLSI